MVGEIQEGGHVFVGNDALKLTAAARALLWSGGVSVAAAAAYGER